jgi:Fic-DOC domain mobile mystery protein B
MGLDLEYIYGQTPIDEEEKEGLLIATISTKGELDEFEQQNIEEAMLWAYGKNFKAQKVFTEKFILNLHKRMFGNVWGWAGIFRKTNKNIGIPYYKIPVNLKRLCDDAIYWVEHETYQPDEIAIRFKHLLVSIHCFPNGNGRHSRLIADIIIEKVLGLKIFSWGAGNLSKSGDARTNYLQAVKAADKGDYSLLLKFARS